MKYWKKMRKGAKKITKFSTNIFYTNWSDALVLKLTDGKVIGRYIQEEIVINRVCGNFLINQSTLSFKKLRNKIRKFQKKDGRK
jgi:hypothetical protein